MLDIKIRTIQHKDQKYPTVGDYLYNVNPKKKSFTMEVLVSETGNWKEELLIAVHELIEASICAHRGITDKEITDFDTTFENARKNTNVAPFMYDEPGNCPSAPYYNEHQFATEVEKKLCLSLGLSWSAYEDHLEELYNPFNRG